ncbi:MAG TPA: DUF3617 domain-containing protein [Steroidobacteraceae bacterium]|nr:DUF3617 domain-containing protein [Steroidobacteraceae bacterium]
MTRSLAVFLTALAALSAYATGVGLKPGLWEVRVVKQVVDGQDMTAQRAAQAAKMQQTMAAMPPEQRAKMEAMFKQNGVSQGSDGGYRLCISAEMAQRDTPIVDKDGRCQPAKVIHSGNHTTYEFSCSSNGITTVGKGETTAAGDLITTRSDMTMTRANGPPRVMHNESEMKYLGSDCGGLKPLAPPEHPQ